MIPDNFHGIANWRLIKSQRLPGPWNMAIDEAILEFVGNLIVPPTLRFYSWDPPCLSIGYAQKKGDVNLISLNQEGWGLVRRPTGGRAILHTDELTYSIITPTNEPRTAGGVLESYQRIAQGLLGGLQILEMPAETKEKYQSGTNDALPGPVCFDAPSNWEITVKGKKIIGSAQTRRKYGVLQHGTLPLYGDLTRIIRALNFLDEKTKVKAAKKLLDRATTIFSISGKKISWDDAAKALQKGFEKALKIQFIEMELTPEEKSRAAILVKEKYANPIWTNRV